MKTPNYVLTENFTFYQHGWGGDSRLLPEGASVRPIELYWVPKHVLEHKRWESFNKDTDVFVYCRYGFVAVPKKIVREK